MQGTAHKRFRITAGIFSRALLMAVLAVLPAACGEKDTTETRTEKSARESFTFFELGSNSVLSKAVRKELADRLGRDAIERRSVLNLETNYPGFLKAHFPRLDQLNQKLNSPPRERIEHNTVKLMYRYAQKKNVPFDYVELVFSGYTQTPVLFRIHFKKDESNIIKTLKEKYGSPRTIEWKETTGTTFYWTKADDELMVSLVPDQFGDSEYQIVIYFTENLNQIIHTEETEKEAREQQRAKSGKSAF
jgi:hypothetical protein